MSNTEKKPLSFTEWYKANHPSDVADNFIDSDKVNDYAEYYHKVMSEPPLSVKEAVEAKYPYYSNFPLNQMSPNDIVDIKRRAAYFGASLAGKVDWEKLELEYKSCLDNEISVQGDMMQQIFNWFKNRLQGVRVEAVTPDDVENIIFREYPAIPLCREAMRKGYNLQINIKPEPVEQGEVMSAEEFVKSYEYFGRVDENKAVRILQEYAQYLSSRSPKNEVEVVKVLEWMLKQPLLYFENDHWSNEGIQYTSAELCKYFADQKDKP